MGEAQATLFAAEFNRSVRIEARPERLSADAGALLMRDLMDRLGLPELVAEHLEDPRDPNLITHPFLELLRTWVLQLVQGWDDQRDVEVLHDDPIFRLAVSCRRGDRPLRSGGAGTPDGLSSQATLSRILYALAEEGNREGLAHILRELVLPFLDTEAEEVTLDLDSVPHEVHGHQPGSAYNGHYHTRCFHPLVASVNGRYFLGGRLRPGSAYTADGGLDFVLPLLQWLKTRTPRVWLRADAGFPASGFLDGLEEKGVPYVCRLRSNAVLERMAEPYLCRPPGHPPAGGRTWFHEIRYKARPWKRARRVVLVVLERPDAQQHLFLDHFFLVTSASVEEESAPDLLDRYRRRGTAESDFGAFKSTVAPTLSSTPRPKTHYRGRRIPDRSEQTPDTFAANEAKLLLGLLAANLMAAGADLLSTEQAPRMSRDRFRTLLLKTAARVLLGNRHVTVVISAARAPLWQRFRAQLQRLAPARGSPQPQALPAPA